MNRLSSLLNRSLMVVVLASPTMGANFSSAGTQPPARPLIRIAAAQPKARLVDPNLTDPTQVLARVEQSLGELAELVHKAGAARCDAVALPEDTLGLGRWEAAHNGSCAAVLRPAVERMLDRLGQAAATNEIYLVCCNDTADENGSVRNSSFLLGRDGHLIGRYDKVNMPIHELDKKRGTQFPVFKTTDLGDVGMLICYDMVFPEAARCLALAGADLIFHPTLGGAAIGDDDMSIAAFRTRAVENFVYLIVAQRGNGSMIVSPQGQILARAQGPDDLAIADINPFGGREGGDSMNSQRDMRARLFRERSPAAFAILSDPNPPVLAKVPVDISVHDAVEISQRALTVGDARFNAADALKRQGRTAEAVTAFKVLQVEFPQTWIDRVASERLSELQAKGETPEVSTSSGKLAVIGAESAARTSLSDPNIRFTVPEKGYVVLRRGPLRAVIVDNRAVDDEVLPGHRAGYHGVASLTHERQGRNLFVPAYAGLNFEHIHDGTIQAREVLFEPRYAPMQLRLINEYTAELFQPATPFWGLESCLRYELTENGGIEVTFECIPRRATWKNDYLGLFWASYIHQPDSLDIHFLEPGPNAGVQWCRGVSPEHGVRATHRAVDDERSFAPAPNFPLSLLFNFSEHRFAQPWYFGQCRGMAFAQVFRTQDQVRLSQSPSGGGAGNPAWDLQAFIEHPRVGQRFQLIMRAIYLPVPAGEREAREEVRQALGAFK